MMSGFRDLAARSARPALAVALGGIVLAAAPWAAGADEPASDWGCSCLTYQGKPESCYMFAGVTGPVLNFGAFETSGSGPYSVKSANGETVLTGEITTGTGSKMTVIIALPDGGKPALVFIEERKPGGETFTAECKGKLPAAK